MPVVARQSSLGVPGLTTLLTKLTSYLPLSKLSCSPVHAQSKAILLLASVYSVYLAEMGETG